MDHKSLGQIHIKNADKGEVSAVFATFNVVDKDGDVTLPGAFDEGAPVVISAYDHKVWQGAMPVGQGRIRTTSSEAILEGQFFVDTTHGRDTFNTVKGLAQRGLGEWSYGYRILDSSPGEYQGKSVQFLKSLAVKEVSPVFEGAGINTRTLAVKSYHGEGAMTFEYKAAIRPHDTKTVSAAWDASAVVKGIPDSASVSDLRSVFAWVDSNNDPEAKSSYKFPHHQGVGGAANIRACVAAIAALNGARGGSSIPASDRKGVYNHLAQHLRNADRNPPELRGSSEDASLKFTDELAIVLCDVSSAIDRASEVMALRATKGRMPSADSQELLAWLDEDLKRMRTLLTSTEDDAAHELARFLRFQALGE